MAFAVPASSNPPLAGTAPGFDRSAARLNPGARLGNDSGGIACFLGIPMTDFIVARKKMVENQLRTSGITDHRLLAVMAQVPREIFVPAERQGLAYIDDTHRLPSAGAARYLSAPAPFARLVQLASVGSTDTVLDVGCGTGYSTAVLASLAERVVELESDAALAVAARANLSALDLGNVTIVEGPLEAGAMTLGPYDVIVIEGAVEAVPDGLLEQLADGGRLVVLLRRGAAPSAHIYVRSGKDVASRAEFNTTLPPLPTAKSMSEFVF